jgi:outer membrane protein OmpA-like peptidoglycan-associated protein
MKFPNRFILLIFFLTVSVNIFSQQPYKTESKKAIEFYKDGLAGYNSQNYVFAEQDLKEAIKIDKNFQNAYFVLAEVYWDWGKYPLAIEYYAEGLKIDSTFYPRGYLNKGKLEMKTGLYVDAIKSFKTYLLVEPNNPKYKSQALQGIKQARFASYAVEHPVDFNPINLGPNVNSQFDEYWPSLSADGQTLVITRKVPSYNVGMGNQLQEDFYISKFEDGVWKPMKNAGSPLNTPSNEGAQSISADGKMMVYTVCDKMGVIGRCDIYYSVRQGEMWSTPKNMGPPVNTASKETQPSLSADGRTIYFASDRPGGKGGSDIWVSTMNEDSTWQVPVNLGDSINTDKNEMSPFIHQDNNTLYFASESHPGMGGFDLFISRRDDNGNFTQVKNMGYPINTQADEFGLIVNSKGDKAYYSSDINKEYGKDIFQFDLYSEARPMEVSYLKGQVFDEKSRERLKAKFELYNLNDGKLVSRSESDERTGEFLICLPTNIDYMLNVERKGYLFYSDNFALKGVFHLEEPFLKNIPLKRIETGGSIVLKNIFYATDSYILLPESKYELDKVVKFLNTNTQIKVEISGHTDNIGTESYNQLLSENRAKSVVQYLTSQGIIIERLSYKGYGFMIPVDSNDTPEGRAKNRRTELKITG